MSATNATETLTVVTHYRDGADIGITRVPTASLIHGMREAREESKWENTILSQVLDIDGEILFEIEGEYS